MAASIFSPTGAGSPAAGTSMYAPMISSSALGSAPPQKKGMPVPALQNFLGQAQNPMMSILRLGGPQYADQIQQYQMGYMPTASFF